MTAPLGATPADLARLGEASFNVVLYPEIARPAALWLQRTYGQPLTTSLADYLMPMARDVPDCDIEHVETPNPLNPLGVKGAGEGGTIPAPAAIIAAVEDALSPFGVHFTEMQLTPDRIVAALQAAGAYEKLQMQMKVGPHG